MAGGNQQVDGLPLIPDPVGADVYAPKDNTDYRVRTGQAGGLATLDGTGVLASAQKPTYSKADVGLGNVDNTSDLGKPISTATQTALDLKANLASPTFTGAPKAPTPATADDSTTLATTAFIKNQNYVVTSWTITAGNGLTGGGDSSANRTITLGTPTTVTGSSTNTVTASSHTHALTLAAADINGALGYTAGYMNVPLTVQNSNYTFVAGDVGKGRMHTDATARTYTLPPDVFSIGDVLTVINYDVANITIARGSGVTLNIAGVSGGASANRTVGPRGVASIICVANNSFFIGGPGVS